MESLLADGLDDILGLGIGFFMLAVIPLVYLLLSHQRKMTQLLHRAPLTQEQDARIDRLQAEVSQLKERVNHLVLQSDDRRELQGLAQPPSIPEHARSREPNVIQ